MTTTRNKLLNLFKSTFNTETIEDDATVLDLGGDSLDEIELLLSVEEIFETDIDDAEWEKCSTFGEYLALIEVDLAG